VYLNTNVNKNTTTQDIGQGSNPIHIKWNAAKQSEFVESIFNNETAFLMNNVKAIKRKKL
jgi:hypothetical protein